MTETLEPDSPRLVAPDGDSDRPDVHAASRGDRDAFERLVRRHESAVVTAARYLTGDHHDALEVAQEAFLKAWRSLGTFRADATFRTWVLRIATNTARSLRTRRRAKKRSEERTIRLTAAGTDDGCGSPAPSVASREPTPDAVLEQGELREALERAIQELDPEFREIIILRDISGASYESIGASLDLPLGTVKSKVHRARLKLREALTPYL